MGAERAVRRLGIGMRVVGVLWVVFFAGAFVALATDSPLAHRDNGLGRFVAWGEDGHDYALMLSIIYVVWGVFTWRAARDPLAHRSFLDFTITANYAHIGLMLVLALVRHHEHAHLAGDVAAGFLPPILLSILWWPIRSRVPARL
ncbi:DUF6632 domain-containing protein [Amycolatopsis anabasis]|uniref:DUF6632 domain-containing protein n=1 Tax=Amycolatopsis anabasis TaxID=1840409 RepID=UPI0031B574D1